MRLSQKEMIEWNNMEEKTNVRIKNWILRNLTLILNSFYNFKDLICYNDIHYLKNKEIILIINKIYWAISHIEFKLSELEKFNFWKDKFDIFKKDEFISIDELYEIFSFLNKYTEKLKEKIENNEQLISIFEWNKEIEDKYFHYIEKIFTKEFWENYARFYDFKSKELADIYWWDNDEFK